MVHIAKYFQEHPELAGALLDESYAKRFTPSLFIQEQGTGFRVGWFTKDWGYQCTQEFCTLADAAADYLLFSPGRRRRSELRPQKVYPRVTPIVFAHTSGHLLVRHCQH